MRAVYRLIAMTLTAAAMTAVFALHTFCKDGGRIALTFDDGPHPSYTEEILSLLGKYDIKATFFVVGENVRLWPDIVIKEMREGHEIGNHTDTHPHLASLSRDGLRRELIAAEETLYEAAEFRPHLFRPPEGRCTKAVSDGARELGYEIVLWDVDTRDWCRTSQVSKIVQTVTEKVRDGDIILFHDYIVRDHSVTAEALREIIPALRERGFEFVRVSELPGKSYSSSSSHIIRVKTKMYSEGSECLFIRCAHPLSSFSECSR